MNCNHQMGHWSRVSIVMSLGAAILLALALLPVRATGDNVDERYKQAWQERERSARTPEARGDLAEDLLEAAKGTYNDAVMAAHLARRCHDWGARDRVNFHIAAKGLEHLAELDESFRAESLDKLHGLYERAWSENRKTKLGYGMTTAEVSVRLARQMLADFERERYTQGMSPEQMLAELRKVTNEYRAAEGTARAVLASARSLSRRYERVDKTQSAKLDAFIAEREPLLEQIEQEKKAPDALAKQLLRLAGQIRRFKTSESKDAAEEVGQIYIIELDSPEEAIPYVKHYMDEKGQHMVALATQPITKLKPQDAFELGQWYGGLSEEADEAGKPSMLLRAYDYLALASKSLPAAKRSEAEAKLAKVESSMSDLGINPPTQVASIEPVISTPAPVTPEPVTPEPVTPEPATSSSNTGLPPSTTSSLPPSTSSARPSRRKRTQVCPTCKREFMAMPGQRREICEWCDEGKKNIFEFD